MSDEKKSAEETIEEGIKTSVDIALKKLGLERGGVAVFAVGVLEELAKVAFMNGVYRGFMTGALEEPGDDDTFDKLVADIERLQPSVKETARWNIRTRRRPMSKDFELGFAVALAAADFDEKFILKALSEARPEDA